MDEFERNQTSEINEFLEYKTSPDNPIITEAFNQKEYSSYEEYTEIEEQSFNVTEDRTKKTRSFNSLSAGIVSSIAALAVGMTSWINVGMKAEFTKVDFLDGVVSYEISVEDMTDGETLIAKLMNGDELIFEDTLIDEDGDGIIKGKIAVDAEEINALLNQNGSKQTYRLNLSGNVGLNVERKFDSFLIELERMESKFESVTGDCHCAEDGCFHFKLNYKDDMKVFDNFEAYIEDPYGNVAQCNFTDNLHDEQTIFVLDLKGSVGTLIVKYTANGKPQTVSIDIKM